MLLMALREENCLILRCLAKPGLEVAEAVVLNGAGRVAANAPRRLLGAEQKARAAGRGIWRE
jgi:hypothetical protein